MRLAALQRALQAHILHGDATIAAQVPGTAHFDTATRLAVYRDGYAERLIEALGQTYPALQDSLGAAEFARRVRQLAHESPSRHYSVRYYGQALEALLARELTGARAAGAADLARFEWALAAAFDAPDAPPLSLEQLQRVAPAQWARLRFKTTPSLQMLELQSNAVRFWRAACEGAPRPARWQRRRAQRWVLWRRELAVYFRPLAPDEAAVLDLLRAGATFQRQCAAVASLHGAARAPVRAAMLLRGWTEEGLLIAWRLGRHFRA